MFRVILAGAGLACLVTTPVSAQVSEDFEAEFEAAQNLARADQLDGAEVRALAAEMLADTAEERVQALSLLAYINSEQEDWQEVWNQASEAEEIVNANFPGSESTLAQLYSYQLRAGEHVGLTPNEMMDIAQRRNALMAGADDLRYWRVETEGLRHRFSNFLCPDTLGQARFQEFQIYEAGGHDVSCSYLWPGPRPIITLHMFRLGDLTNAEGFEHATGSMRIAFPNMRELSVGEMDVGGVTVLYGHFGLSDRTTSTFTTQIGNWSLKLRFTHAGSLTEEDINAFARIAFEGAGDMVSHIARCDALSGVTDRVPPSDGGLEEASAVLLTTLISDEVAPGPASPLQCYLGPVDFSGGGIALAELDEQGNPLRFVARQIRSDAYTVRAIPPLSLTSEDGVARREWHLVLDRPDDMLIFPQFTDRPDPDTFVAAAGAIVRNEADAISRLSLDEEGNFNIELRPRDAGETAEPDASSDEDVPQSPPEPKD